MDCQMDMARGLLKIDNLHPDMTEESLIKSLSSFGVVVFATVLIVEKAAYVMFELHESGWFIDIKIY